jgi:hypothetical protein
VLARLEDRYEIFDWRNAMAILEAVHPEEAEQIADVLDRFVLRWTDIAVGGGNKSNIARFLDRELGASGWVEKSFDTRFLVDGIEVPSPTHAVDCFRNKVALEVEWNNKDPFFDRDLNNFRLLYDLRVIDVGVIVTRATSLETVLRGVGRANTVYGKATTHTDKLYPKIQGGGAGGCPVLVFGITERTYVDDRDAGADRVGLPLAPPADDLPHDPR